MKIVKYVAGSCVLIAGLAWGQGSQVVLEDDFNDGVRNSAVWKASHFYDGLFTERNGALYFACPSGAGVARWTAKNGYLLPAGDILVFEALLSAGSQVSTEQLHRLDIGLGFADQPLNPSKLCLVYLARTSVGLVVSVECNGAWSHYRTFVIPAGYARYVLTLRYNTATGKITVSYRSVGGMFSIILGTIPINKWWGIPVGESAPLTPMLAAQTYGVPVVWGNKTFLDRAKVTIIVP
jgi:hypothetical protein